MATSKPGEKKLLILQTLASMLENPKTEKITTATLAARIGVSEAALYRHFASKAQMFEGLIDFIENSVFGLINQIAVSQEHGQAQAQEIMLMLLEFSARNPGMTKVMTGHALINEDPRLQQRMNQFVDRIELALKQALRVSAQAGAISEPQAVVYASLILAAVLGRWQRFVNSSFKHDPLENAPQQIQALLSW